MLQAVITAPGKVTFCRTDIPAVPPGHVLIKTAAVGICTLELRAFRGEAPEYPFFGGHEAAGVIVALPPEGSATLQLGMGAATALLQRCGTCRHCKAGMDNLCELQEPTVPGSPRGPGGFSEYILARENEVHPIPAGTDLPTACLAEPIACVLRSISAARIKNGSSVLVIGTGVMGVLHIILARMQGAVVIVSEKNAQRRANARNFGAQAVIDPNTEKAVQRVRDFTGGWGADAVFFTAGGAEAVSQGADCLADGGTLVVYGSTPKGDSLYIDPRELHYREILLTGVTKHTRNSFQNAVSLLPKIHAQLQPLLGTRWNFSQLPEALEQAGSSRTYRDLVIMNQA